MTSKGLPPAEAGFAAKADKGATFTQASKPECSAAKGMPEALQPQNMMKADSQKGYERRS